MRKTILALAALCLAGNAFSQENSILLYGRAGLNTTKLEDSSGNTSSQTNITFSPAVGYWLSDNLALGVLLGVSWQKQKINYIPKTITTGSYVRYEAGAFIRYRQPVNDLFFVHADLYGVYGTGTTTINDSTKAKGTRAFTVALMPALGINISPKSAVTLALGSLYYSADHDPVSKFKRSGLHMDFAQLISIGFQTNIALKANKNGHL
jgi:hypothetical protein